MIHIYAQEKHITKQSSIYVCSLPNLHACFNLTSLKSTIKLFSTQSPVFTLKSHLNARQRLVGPNRVSSNHIDPVIVDCHSRLVLT